MQLLSHTIVRLSSWTQFALYMKFMLNSNACLRANHTRSAQSRDNDDLFAFALARTHAQNQEPGSQTMS